MTSVAVRSIHCSSTAAVISLPHFEFPVFLGDTHSCRCSSFPHSVPLKCMYCEWKWKCETCQLEWACYYYIARAEVMEETNGLWSFPFRLSDGKLWKSKCVSSSLTLFVGCLLNPRLRDLLISFLHFMHAQILISYEQSRLYNRHAYMWTDKPMFQVSVWEEKTKNYFSRKLNLYLRQCRFLKRLLC